MELQTTTDVMAALADQNIETLPTNDEIGTQTADDVLTTADEDTSTRIGSLVISTTGSGSTLQVPHVDLVAKMKTLGFSPGLIPSPTEPRIAFTRAKNDLLSEYTDSATFDGTRIKFDLWADGHYTQYVVGEYIADGEAQTVTLGHMEYVPEKEAVQYFMSDSIRGTSLMEAWGAGFVATMQERFSHYQAIHTADDIAELTRHLHAKAPHSIKLRRAVYFYPAVTQGLDGVLEAYRKLYSWLNSSYKLRGEATEFFWTPLFNREADKQFITAKLEEHIEAELDALMDDVAESFTDDETAEEIARDVLQPALAQMDSTLAEYEAISETTPRLKRMLRAALSRTTGDARTRAKNVVEAAERSD
jgi:hypothetical protein